MLTMRKCVAGMSGIRGYHNKPVSIVEVKNELRMYTGGSVDLVKHSSGVAELVLNYPESCNALSGSMVVDLDDAVEELQSWQRGKALLLRGANNKGNFFCSGGHLEGLVKKADSSEKGYRLSVMMNRISQRLRDLPLITAAVIDGPALGGGAELLTIPDHRLATNRANVAFVQAKVIVFFILVRNGYIYNAATEIDIFIQLVRK